MGNIHTPTENVKSVHAFSLAITAAAVNGAATDCLGFEAAKAIFYSAPSGSGTTSDCKVQESADGSTGWADVADADFVQVTTVGGAKFYTMNIDVRKRERYLRLVHTGVGASAAGQAYGLIELYEARYNPVAQAETAVSV